MVKTLLQLVDLLLCLEVLIRQVQRQLSAKFSKSNHITNSRLKSYGLRLTLGIMRLLKLESMENRFGKEDSNGMRVISERFVVAQSLNGNQCLQEQN